MQSNAWQGSYVRSPAIKKKAQGAKGEGEESRWRRRRGGWRQRGRLFFLRSEAAEQSRHGKAGEWENGAESGGIAPQPSSQTHQSVRLDLAQWRSG